VDDITAAAQEAIRRRKRMSIKHYNAARGATYFTWVNFD
jgi:hypothetical protein